MTLFVGRRPARAAVAAGATVFLSAGCTSLGDWCRNGFKVGPNFQPPAAAVSANWIDAGNPRLAPASPDPAWWTVFGDPVLTDLVSAASRDNLDLKTAGTRVLQAQAQRNIAAGQLFPQSQQLQGAYVHAQLGPNGNFLTPLLGQQAGGTGLTTGPSGPSYINLWTTGFNASWELDFWGRYRRAIESADAGLAAAVEGVHDALVILSAEVASNYVQARTYQQRLEYARANVEAQRGALRIAQARLTEGRATGLDVAQAEANLAQTEATIPPLEVGLRQANNRLNVLLGRPTGDLVPGFGPGGIPATPPTAAIGIPAELLERRPDVRRALREAAAQSALIGVAEADFYPSVGVSGFLGTGSTDIRHLFEGNSSFTGYILPNFQWKILNYGRVLNTVRLQDARLQERILTYQQTVLSAGREVEDAAVGYVQYQLQAQALERSVKAAEKSVELVLEQYREGRTDFNRVFTTQAQLAAQQDQLAAARGSVALSLISVYRALGGGWRAFDPDYSPTPRAPELPAPAAGVPAPQPSVPGR